MVIEIWRSINCSKGKRKAVCCNFATHCSVFFTRTLQEVGLTLMAFWIAGTWSGGTSPHCSDWTSLFSPLSSGIGQESHCANDLHAVIQLLINFLLFMVMIPRNSLWGRIAFVGQRIPLENSDRSIDCLLGILR